MAAALAVALLLSGCTSITLRRRERRPGVYPGVRDDAYYIMHPFKAEYPEMQWMSVIDLPFSALLDTLLLPMDLSDRARARKEVDNTIE